MNSKKLFMAATFLLVSISLRAQTSGFTLTGKLANVNTGSKIYLVYFNPNLQKDSAVVQNGSFEFKGDLSSPVHAQLFLPHGKQSRWPIPLMGDLDFAEFFLDKGVININATDSVKYMTITNSKINDENKQLSQTLAMIESKKNPLRVEYKRAPAEQRKDSTFIKQINDKEIKINKEIEAAKIYFAKNNPDSYVSLRAIYELTRGRTMDYHQMDSAYNLLSNRYKNTFLADETKQLIGIGINTTVGAQALDFAQPDANGKFYKLSDFKGKYIMLEFWSSWCGPCRQEAPNVVRAYEKYKNKNFTIIGVSLDTKREAWLKAVEEDKIPYLQLSDLKPPRDNAAAALYGVQTIPESYIIDPSGKIIAKNLRGEALNKKLSELFNPSN